MKLTQEQLEAIIADKVKANLELTGKTITEGIEEQIKSVVGTMMKEKPNLKEFVVDDVDPQNVTKDPKAGFKSFADFAIAVKNAEVSKNRNVDKRLEAMVTKAAGTGAHEMDGEYGGYLIPEEFRNQLLQIAIQKSNIMNMCVTIPMATNAINIPYVAGTDRSGGLVHGGVQFYWLDEEGVLTEARPKFGKIQLRLHKLAGLVYASDEILEDSPVSLEPLLTSMFSDAMAWTMDNVFINGSGAGKPLGILNAPALISVSKETGQTATTIQFENVTKMYMRQYNKGGCIWMANDDTLMQLASMSLAVGVAGVPVWMPAGGINGKPYDTLFGKPLIFTEQCQTLGTVGDIINVDWSQYLVGQKSGGNVQFASSIHLKFDYDQTAFRFIFRVDGQPWWPAPLTTRYSSATMSPFIALATRA